MIFTIQSEYDFTAALIKKHNRNIDLKEKTIFIAVPPGIPEAENFKKHHAHPESKSDDIAFFGMIRPGRGMEGTLVEFATHLKKALPQSTLRIVGSSVWEEVNVDEIDAILHEISMATYPEKTQELSALSGQKLVEKITELQACTPESQRTLNIHIHFNEQIEDVVRIVSGCKFAYMPFTRGATDHSSSLPTTVGLCPVTISNIGVQTRGNVETVIVPSESPTDAVVILKEFIAGIRPLTDFSAQIETYMNERSWKNLAIKSDRLYVKVTL